MACTVTDDYRLEILDLESRGIVEAVNAKLICVFIFAYAKCCFSHDTAHLFVKW